MLVLELAPCPPAVLNGLSNARQRPYRTLGGVGTCSCSALLEEEDVTVIKEDSKLVDKANEMPGCIKVTRHALMAPLIP